MTKIDIYSGFLGAGKTTLIKKMIKEAYHSQKLVLIENEFGEIGIDGGFLQEAGIQITEMNSGCICCSLVGDFGRALKKVIAEYAPDRILIEPSGVGKLSDVIGAVRKVTSDDVQLGNFVTVADATKCKMYMKNFGEFYNNQIETANTIILSRTSGMDEAKLEKAGIRTEIDLRNEKIGFKIREAQMQKIPYMFVLGDKEVENGVLSVRSRKGAVETMTYDEVLAKLREAIETKAL